MKLKEHITLPYSFSKGHCTPKRYYTCTVCPEPNKCDTGSIIFADLFLFWLDQKP